MKDNPENRQFEDQWTEAFNSAELKPSENVWTGIDAHLANKAAGNYKKRALVYRWVAAAAVLLLFTWSGYILYNNSLQNQETLIADSEELVVPQMQEQSEIAENNQQLAINEARDLEEAESSETVERKTDPGSTDQLDPGAEKAGSAVAQTESMEAQNESEATQSESALSQNESAVTQTETTVAQTESTFSQQSLPVTNEEQKNDLVTKGAIATNAVLFPVADENTSRVDRSLEDVPVKGYALTIDDMAEPEEINIEGLPVWDFDLEETDAKEALWAGLNFAPGLFDPNFTNTSVAAQNLATESFDVPVAPSVAESKVDQGFSYGFGVNAGFPLGKRWVLESGLAYSVGNSETSTSLILEDANGERSALVFTNSDEVQDLNSSVSLSSPTEVTSSYEFLSVPVKAGFAILTDKKLGLIVSAGVASDFFIRNKISSDQEGVGSFSQSSGSDSPFRTVYFSGLSSVTITYRVGTNYLIMVEPTYKGAISDFSKSSELFESRPSSFGVALGIRYQFNK